MPDVAQHVEHLRLHVKRGVRQQTRQHVDATARPEALAQHPALLPECVVHHLRQIRDEIELLILTRRRADSRHDVIDRRHAESTEAEYVQPPYNIRVHRDAQSVEQMDNRFETYSCFSLSETLLSLVHCG